MHALPPFAPHAVVFDLDGLLVDSEGLWGQAEERVVTGLGFAWDPSVREFLLGRGPADAARVLAEHLGGVDEVEVARLMLEAILEEFAAGVPLRPGAARLVESLHPALPLAVATNSRRSVAEAALASSGLQDCFDAVVTADDVGAPKPAPEPYVTACARVGADPSLAVAFEDSPVGAASAKAAGLWVVACPSTPGTRFATADAVVASLEEFDLDALRAQVPGVGRVGSRGSRARPM